MNRIGLLAGVGAILVGHNRFDDIKYKIHIGQESVSPRHPIGTLEGSPKALMAAVAWKSLCILQLETGETVAFLVSDYTIPGNTAEIECSGPIPGY